MSKEEIRFENSDIIGYIIYTSKNPKLDNEIFYLINDFRNIIPNIYGISNLGRIFNIKTGQIKDGRIESNTKRLVDLLVIDSTHTKKFYVSQIVYYYFIDKKYTGKVYRKNTLLKNHLIDAVDNLTNTQQNQINILSNNEYKKEKENKIKENTTIDLIKCNHSSCLKKLYNENFKNFNNYYQEILEFNEELFKNIGILEDNDLSDFWIDRFGNIYNKNLHCFLSTYNNEDYKYVSINEKKYRVHRLVAYVYLENGKEYYSNKNYQVNHIDKNRQNNYYENLEWILFSEHILKDQGYKIYEVNNDGILNKIFYGTNELKEYLNQKSVDFNRHEYRGNKILYNKNKDKYYVIFLDDIYKIGDKVDILNLRKDLTNIIKCDLDGNVLERYNNINNIKKNKEFQNLNMSLKYARDNKTVKSELLDKEIIEYNNYLWKYVKKNEKIENIFI